MTAKQLVKRSINVNNNSPIQDYNHLDDHAYDSWVHTSHLGSHLEEFYIPVIPGILVIQITLVIVGFLVTLATILVKNLETLACVSPYLMLIWVLQWSQCFKTCVAQHWGGRGHITVTTKV